MKHKVAIVQEKQITNILKLMTTYVLKQKKNDSHQEKLHFFNKVLSEVKNLQLCAVQRQINPNQSLQACHQDPRNTKTENPRVSNSPHFSYQSNHRKTVNVPPCHKVYTRFWARNAERCNHFSGSPWKIQVIQNMTFITSTFNSIKNYLVRISDMLSMLFLSLALVSLILLTTLCIAQNNGICI